jgi:hypothetical protein
LKDWEKAEQIISRLTKSKVTVGSGNSWQKGDIQTKNCLIEVKQSNKQVFVLEKEWFTKVSREALKFHKEPILCCFSSLHGAIYYKDRIIDISDNIDKKETDWKTKSVKEWNFPETLVIDNYIWKRGELKELRDFL